MSLPQLMLIEPLKNAGMSIHRHKMNHYKMELSGLQMMGGVAQDSQVAERIRGAEVWCEREGFSATAEDALPAGQVTLGHIRDLMQGQPVMVTDLHDASLSWILGGSGPIDQAKEAAIRAKDHLPDLHSLSLSFHTSGENTHAVFHLRRDFDGVREEDVKRSIAEALGVPQDDVRIVDMSRGSCIVAVVVGVVAIGLCAGLCALFCVALNRLARAQEGGVGVLGVHFWWVG